MKTLVKLMLVSAALAAVAAPTQARDNRESSTQQFYLYEWVKGSPRLISVEPSRSLCDRLKIKLGLHKPGKVASCIPTR